MQRLVPDPFESTPPNTNWIPNMRASFPVGARRDSRSAGSIISFLPGDATYARRTRSNQRRTLHCNVPTACTDEAADRGRCYGDTVCTHYLYKNRQNWGRENPQTISHVTSTEGIANPPPCLGTLRRGRMPRAAWQGFCTLLRDPPLRGTHLLACIAPTPRGPWVAMAHP